jgi:tol-pal system protein YbgF
MPSLITASRISLLLISAVLLSACQTPREQDPTWQKLTEVDGRVLRIERVINNQSLLDLAQKDESLQTELRTLRGQLEEVQHSVDTVRAQQKDVYADLDKRIAALEKAKSAAPAVSASAQILDRDAYQIAFNLLKDGKYTEASAAFSQFIASYPQSGLVDNAHYWLGESYYILKDFGQAQRAFQTLLDTYPNSGKAPDALVKLGFTQYELKANADARATLQRVLDQYPDSNAAKLAQQRLAKMASEGR